MTLGDRMKEYENVSRIYLTRRIPMIIRVDGRAFHTYTKNFRKPFDKVFLPDWKKRHGNDSRKVGADYYIDDKAIFLMME